MMKTLQNNLKALVGVLTLALAMIVVANKSHAATYTVPVPLGFSPIANNLNSTLAGGNTLANLFNATTTSPPLPAGTQILIWNCALHVFETHTKTTFGSGWAGSGATALLNPGTGAFINVPSGSGFTVTFDGNVPTATTSKLPCIPAGSCGLLSSQPYLPNQLAEFKDVAGFEQSDCYSVAKYIPGQPIQPVTPANYTIYTFFNNTWFPSAPTVAPGESVWICNQTNCHSYNLECIMTNSLAYLGGGNFTNAAPFVKPDGFGNVYVGASTMVSANNWDVVLLKYDCNCVMVPGWPRTFDELGGIDELIGMDVDPGGNLYITCASSLSTRGAVTIKYDPAGNVIWQRLFPTPLAGGFIVGSFRPVGIAVDSVGGVRVAGTALPASSGPSRIAAVRYPVQNNIPVAANLSQLAPFSIGDRAKAMTLDAANRVLVAGEYQTALGTSCLTVRFRPNLLSNRKWLPVTVGRNLSGVAITSIPAPLNRIHMLASDSYLGVDRWTILSYQNTLLMTPVAGGWSSGGPGQLNYGTTLFPKAIAGDASGNVTATGRDYSAGWITAKWDALATPLWSATSPTIGVAPSALELDIYGNALVTGGANGFPSDYLTARYNGVTGVLDWFPDAVFDFGGHDDTASDLALDAAGNVYVTGQSRHPSGDVLATLKYSQGPPANDSCATAQELTNCNPGTVAFNNRFATDTSPSVSLCGADIRDVWYKWVAPCNGMVDIDTCGSCLDTVLEVYDAGIGGACATMAPLFVCNDDTGPTDGRCPNGTQSYAQFMADAGKTYFIQVGGKTLGDGRLTLTGPNPTAGTCPTGPYSAWRVFRLTGTANGLNWPWSISIPCCANVEGIAGPVTLGGTTLDLAQAFRTSLNAACPGAIQAQILNPSSAANAPKRLRVRVRRCTAAAATCNNNSFVFRVGPNGTPFNQLCIVPNAVGNTISTLSLSGICQFNPEIEEEYVPFEDCNGNGEPDDFDIAEGTSLDANTNSIPDECEAGCTNGGETYTVELQAGWNFLANQLMRPGGNTVGNVLPGAPDGALIRKWNQGSGSFGAANNYSGGLWDDEAMTLSPGEGFVLDVSTATTLTFAGCANPPHFLPIVTNGCALVANTTNAPARFEDLFGQSPANCTTLTLYEGTNALTHTYFAGYGWSPSEPVLGVGESAFVCADTNCLPLLAVQSSVTNVTLSWSDANFHLQATPFVLPSPIWTNVPGASPVTLPIGPSPLFFRLAVP